MSQRLLRCRKLITTSCPVDCISKVALNMYDRKLSRELDSVSSIRSTIMGTFLTDLTDSHVQEGFTVISIHPGCVNVSRDML